jgi:hypothetical protein
MLAEQIRVVMTVAEALESLGAPYALGGALAGALFGVLRATNDADLLAELHPAQVEPLVRALGSAFCADPEMMRGAIDRRGSLNLIHLAAMFKADVFVARPRDFDRAQLARRKTVRLSADSEQEIYVTSAEDLVLAKLEWYRLGGEISDRRWSDVLGVLRIQDERLDRDYMRRTAIGLGVGDLLERALEQVG